MNTKTLIKDTRELIIVDYIISVIGNLIIGYEYSMLLICILGIVIMPFIITRTTTRVIFVNADLFDTFDDFRNAMKTAVITDKKILSPLCFLLSFIVVAIQLFFVQQNLVLNDLGLLIVFNLAVCAVHACGITFILHKS